MKIPEKEDRYAHPGGRNEGNGLPYSASGGVISVFPKSRHVYRYGE